MTLASCKRPAAGRQRRLWHGATPHSHCYTQRPTESSWRRPPPPMFPAASDMATGGSNDLPGVERRAGSSVQILALCSVAPLLTTVSTLDGLRSPTDHYVFALYAQHACHPHALPLVYQYHCLPPTHLPTPLTIPRRCSPVPSWYTMAMTLWLFNARRREGRDTGGTA